MNRYQVGLVLAAVLIVGAAAFAASQYVRSWVTLLPHNPERG